MESIHFWPSFLHVALYKTLFFDFYLWAIFAKNIKIAFSFLFLDGIKPFWLLVLQYSTKRCSSISDLGPLRPKFTPQNLYEIAYNSGCMADRPHMFAPTRGFSGMADSMEPRKMLRGRPLLPWQRNWG